MEIVRLTGRWAVLDKETRDVYLVCNDKQTAENSVGDGEFDEIVFIPTWVADKTDNIVTKINYEAV